MLWGGQMNRLIAVVVVAVVLIVGACGDGESEFTVDGVDLIGTWSCARCGGALVHFDEDGTYRIVAGSTNSRDVAGTTVEQGQFTLEGTLFTFISNEDSQNCETGQRGSYEMEVLEELPSGQDRLKQIQVQDECVVRGSVRDVTLVRVP